MLETIVYSLRQAYMETITVQVDAQTAQAYRDAAPEKQEKVSTMLKLFLQTDFTDKSLSKVMA